MIHAALDAGINFIDTADVYSAGESEEIVAKALQGRRDDVVLATKVLRQRWAPTRTCAAARAGGSCASARRACGASTPTTSTCTRCTVPTRRSTSTRRSARCRDLVHQGKVRYLGSSTFPASAIVEAQWVAERRDRERFVCEQPPYSILVRGIEADVLPTCERYGMGVIPWSPLAGGWLSGKWRKGGDGLTSHRANRVPMRYDLSIPENQRKLDAADALGKLADDAGIPLVHLAVAWVISNPAVTSAIIGPRTMEQLATQLGAADVVLDRRRARPHRRDRAARHQLHLGRRRLPAADGRESQGAPPERLTNPTPGALQASTSGACSEAKYVARPHACNRCAQREGTSMTFTPVPPTTRVDPERIAPDTWVIHQVQDALGAPLAVYLNSMVIVGEEPVIVDTGTIANRRQWLDDVFGLVDPADVRWVYLSHDDIDHTGNLEQVMTRVHERDARGDLGDQRATHQRVRVSAAPYAVGQRRRELRRR